MAVIPDTLYKTHTTHSWDFLGLAASNGGEIAAAWSSAKLGEDTIIGVIDTGIVIYILMQDIYSSVYFNSQRE
jgi:hypothetical protein